MPRYNTRFLPNNLESAVKIQLLERISKFEYLFKYQSV